METEQQCPYCGESVEVSVDPIGVSNEHYVEDCPVCCRPWEVTVTRDGDDVFVNLAQTDD